LLRRNLDWGLLALVVLFAIVPPLAEYTHHAYYIDFFRRVMIIALAAVGLDLLLGYGGLISFGHAAFVGIGAYGVGLLAYYGINNGLLQFAIALIASGLFALMVGWISVRTSGVYFIMITLAMAQMLFFLTVSLRQYGGDDGMSLNARSWFPLVDLNSDTQFFYVVLALLSIVIVFCRRLINSRFGMVLRGCMENDRRMRALGFSTNRFKVTAFVIAGCLAGLSGALLANHNEYISPDYMHWSRSGDLLVIVVIGGVGTLLGPVVGSIVFLGLEQVLSGISKHWQIVFGPMLVLIVLLTRGGLISLLSMWRQPPALDVPTPRMQRAGVDNASPDRAGPVTASSVTTSPVEVPPASCTDNPDILLSIQDLTRRFGGLAATDHCSLDVLRGETMGLIGPNGAGKTTLISQLSGELGPDSGRIFFEGRDVTARDMPERVRLGIARSFQITSICRGFTTLQNVMLAVQSGQGGNFNIFADASDDLTLVEPSLDMLDRVGLLARANVKAGTLSHGEQRQLEIAMALALKPKLLLLDEPMAGMSRQEAAKLIAVIRSLKGAQTILLIEHDMDAVFSLADRLTVLVRGKRVVTGSPDAVRSNAEAKASYLGDDESQAGAA
jgi:ABC-type branched-subunit amino acid transport system ATPase component/ABC-type branched-subunit amino acid transport system permease subunit